MAFSLPGNVKLVQVKAGDQVQAGQLLVQLDDATQQIQLEQVNLVLQELTSPEAIANAKLAVTTAQSDVINAQYLVNNQLYWKNTSLIQDQYSNLVIAKENLDKAQAAYDNANVGEYINNADEAALYQALYKAQQAYDNARVLFQPYSQKPTQRQLDEAQATLDLANAYAGKRPNLRGSSDRRRDPRKCQRLRFAGIPAGKTRRSNCPECAGCHPPDGTVPRGGCIRLT